MTQTIEPLTFESAEGREVHRHSSTHIMAQAVKEVFPTAQLTIGPALDEGFYYDFAFERPFTPEDLEKIEARAKDIMKRGLAVTRSELSKQDAIRFFQDRGEAYKVELIQGLRRSITHFPVQPRRVRRSLPRATPPHDRPCWGIQAPVHGGGLLAWR